MATKTIPAAPSTLELRTVNPAELGIRDQAREDATPDEQLVDSVRTHGLIQPPVVEYDAADAQLKIVTGHRRVGAAIAAGLEEITVLVRAATAPPLTLEQQIVENERRKGLTPTDLVRGYQKLTSLFGMRPEDIAAQLAERPARVKAALKITSPGAFRALAEAPALDLEQAALIADFDDDEEAQSQLIRVASTRPEDFARTVTVLRDTRAARKRVEELEARAAAEPVRLFPSVSYDDEQYWNGGKECDWKGRSLSRLGINVADHVKCTGHAAFINRAGSAEHAALVYVCTAPDAYGHTAPVRELTEDEKAEQALRAAAREAAEAARKEADANTAARREWLRGFLAGRLNQTAGLLDFIVDATLGTAVQDDVDQYQPHVMLQLVDGEPHPYHAAHTELTELVVSGKLSALRLLATNAIAIGEDVISDSHTAAAAPHFAAAYLDRLVGWGYTLTDVDRATLAALEESEETGE